MLPHRKVKIRLYSANGWYQQYNKKPLSKLGHKLGVKIGSQIGVILRPVELKKEHFKQLTTDNIW